MHGFCDGPISTVGTSVAVVQQIKKFITGNECILLVELYRYQGW
jgi:hypothetical protein